MSSEGTSAGYGDTVNGWSSKQEGLMLGKQIAAVDAWAGFAVGAPPGRCDR